MVDRPFPMSDDAPSALPPIPVFTAEEQVCGNCKLWQAHSVDDRRGWVGPCRLQPQRGLFVPSAPVCDAFVPRGSVTRARAVEPQTRQRTTRSVAPLVVRHGPAGTSPVVTRAASPVTTVGYAPTPQAASAASTGDTFDFGGGLILTREELIDLFRQAVGDPHPPEMANKWQGGVVQLVPGNKDLQGKELPIDSLFHKVVMIRDRLRTLEQKLNGHPKLTDADKVEMQAYVTRAYGSLTSFNILFRDKNDFFVGQKGDE